MPLISQRAYARHRGVTHRAVQKAIAAGRISLKDGKIDPDLADHEWANNTDETKFRNSVSGDPKAIGRTRENQTGNLQDPESQAVSISYVKGRAIRETYQAKLAKLEYEAKSGRLLPRDECISKWQKALGNLYQKIRALPVKLAPILKNTSSEMECQDILAESIDDCLRELSDFKLADE